MEAFWTAVRLVQEAKPKFLFPLTLPSHLAENNQRILLKVSIINDWWFFFLFFFFLAAYRANSFPLGKITTGQHSLFSLIQLQKDPEHFCEKIFQIADGRILHINSKKKHVEDMQVTSRQQGADKTPEAVGVFVQLSLKTYGDDRLT